MNKQNLHSMCSIAQNERPYEKAQYHGIHTLSDAELLSVIIRTGTKDLNAIDLSNIVMNLHPNEKGIVALNYLTRENLQSVSGIGNVKATQLLALAEICKRMNQVNLKMQITCNNPETIAKYYIEKCKFLQKEHVFLLLLNNKNKLIEEICISKGTVNEALISTRDIFVEAIKFNAVKIILVHNHPSGDSSPSKEDILITTKIKKAGELLDILLLDHIIIGHNNYKSMANLNLL